MSAIVPATLEKALQAWLASKLGLVVDTKLFRGAIPSGVDNAACVRLETPLKENAPVQMDAWNVQILGKFKERDDAMAFVANVSRLVPAHGISITVGASTVELNSVIPRGDGATYQDGPDAGSLKWMATINLIVKAR